MKPTRLAFAVASVLGGCLAFAAGPALANTLVVHTPTDTTCGAGSPFITIQSAVTVAKSGDNINVCPGTYPEQVTIPAGKNNLTLVSVKPLQAIIQAPAVMLPPGAIVRVNGATGTRLRQFTISGPGPVPSSCVADFYGVRVDSAGSAQIEGNHITQIEDNPFSGCQRGVAIQVGRQAEATTGSADISQNLIDNYQKNGITVDNTGSSATIQDNAIRGAGPTGVIAQNGIQISRGATASVEQNFVSDNVFTGSPGNPPGESTGILLFSPGATLVNGNIARSDDTGIYALATDRHTALTGNNASQSTFDGIALDGVTGSTVSGNTSSDNTAAGGQGFDVFDGSTGARLENNTANNNATDGFFADATTSGNTFQSNQARGNGTFDCQDQSTGHGTDGTDNFWINDQGVTSDPMGICQAKQHGQGGGDNGHQDGDHHPFESR